jgi:hypothetical protein
VRNTKLKFRLTLLGVFLAGLLFATGGPSLAEHLDHPSQHPWLAALFPFIKWVCAEILPKVGDALLIAPILAVVVDAAAKQNLLAEFARDVSIHIIGRYLPRELREHIHGYLTVDIVRLDLDLVFTITESATGDGIELDTVMTSDLHNYSFRDIETDIFVAVSKSLNPKIGETIITEVTAGDFTYRHGDSTRELESTGSDELYRTTLRLTASHPGTLPHGTRCIVKSKEYFPVNGQSAFIAVYPVIGTTVTVILPDAYKASIDLTFTKDNAQPLTPIEAPRRCRWKIEDPILQGQGFFLRWSKKPIP